MAALGYERLHAEPVRATAVRLGERIAAKLPDRNLVRVSTELVDLIDDVSAGSKEIRGRLRISRLVSRGLMVAVLIAAAVVLGFAVADAIEESEGKTGFDWLPLIETTVNDLVFVALALFFLYSIPNRLERGHTLSLLHRLRSLAHIIDMHQLTKDPERLTDAFQPTSKSIDMRLDRSELEAYLNYCSELLALVGKAAALCAEESQDAVVLDTVSTIETLTLGMARKCWQKISVLSKV